MEQYLLNFHHFQMPAGVKPAPKELEAVNRQWQNYIGDIAARGLFVGTQRLKQAGSIVSADGTITDAVVDGQGLIVGTLTVKANSTGEAIELAKGCPVLAMGGSVEVRPILPFEM